MASFNSLLIVVTFAVAAVLVVARPQDPPLLALSEVANKTMCPIMIYYDRNDNRIPRVIKHLKCAEKPNELCAKTSHGCCKPHHNANNVHFKTECVEIEDTVLVTYKDSPVPQTLQVSVGCNCMMQESTKAPELS